MLIGVAGSSGFVGSAVVGAVEAAGHTPVPIQVPRLSSAARSLDELYAEAGQLPLIDLPFCLDAVVNAAGVCSPLARMSDAMVGANALLPAVLARSCRAAGARRLVHVSAAQVHGGEVLDELAVAVPGCAYGLSKLWGEELLERVDALETVSYRPTWVHGPDRMITRTMHRFASSPLSSVAGNGEELTPQILVADVAAACLLLATADDVPDHPVIHPPSGETTARVLQHLSGRQPRQITRATATAVLRAAEVAGRTRGRAELHARCLRLLWFGQRQEHGWLDARIEPSPCSAWESLGAEIRSGALIHH